MSSYTLDPCAEHVCAPILSMYFDFFGLVSHRKVSYVCSEVLLSIFVSIWLLCILRFCSLLLAMVLVFEFLSCGSLLLFLLWLLDQLVHSLLFVDLVNEALSVTKEEWCHGEELEG